MLDIYDIEDIILGMAEIVHENRRLRYELKQAQEYEKKYTDLLNRCVADNQKFSAAILEAVFMSCDSKNDKKET